MTLAHQPDSSVALASVDHGRALPIAATLLIVLGAFRDTTIIGNELFLREITAGICLFLALVNLPRTIGRISWHAMALLFGYLAVVSVGAVNATNSLFVFLQGASLFGIVLFALCWHSQPASALGQNYRVMFVAAFYALTLVCLGSLVSVIVAPGLVYEVLYAGEVRFHGLVSKPGWMAAMGGLLAGIALFYQRLPPSIRLIAGVMGLACLGLSGARTYWAAFAVASIACVSLYRPALWRRARLLAMLVVALIIGFIVFKGGDNLAFIGDAARTDSVGSLSGRTTLWEESLGAFGTRPLFGYGLTQGSEVLEDAQSPAHSLSHVEIDPRELSRRTLHNGYIQSLFDTGILGTAFYGLIVIAAILRMLLKDRERRYAGVFFVLVFAAIGNLSENIIYAASVMPSTFFWLIAVFALSARMMPTSRAQARPPTA